MEVQSFIIFVVLMLTRIVGSQNVAPVITVPKNNSYVLPFPEDTPIGTIIFVCNAIDSNDPNTANGTISFNFFGGNQGRKFSMDAVTCTIYLVQKLDFETATHHDLTIRVTDGGGLTNNCSIKITVTDVNDNPPYVTLVCYSCTPNLVWGSQFENVPTNTPFANISCSDPDTGSGKQFTFNVIKGNRTYSAYDTIGVSAITNSQFSYNMRLIDYDSEPDTFTALVDVVDQGTPSLQSSITVILSLKDVDDNPPQFILSTIQTSVNENADLGFTIVRINATDADKPNTPASLITFETICQPDLLTIDRYSGDVIVKSDIDWEKVKFIGCFVNASSVAAVNNTATLTVTVNNINDGSPVFPMSFYSMSVFENTPAGTTIVSITATDPEQDTLTYSIGSSIFNINSSTGAVTLNSIPDYETQTSYLVSITATDNGSPQLSTDILFQVSITPINEYPPVFVGTCSASIPEDSFPGSFIIAVTATDGDAGLDGAVNYIIQTSNVPFYISMSSGEIRLASYLDFETTSSYIFTIQAKDNSTSKSRSTSQTCTIAVIDVNDQAVECVAPPIAVVQFPFPLSRTVSRVDCSVAGNKATQLIYTFVSGNDNGTFQINPTTGDVILSIIPVSQQYNLSINVTNGADVANIFLIILAEQKLTMTNLPTTINKPEGESGTLLFTVNACCAFPTVQYKLLSGNDDNLVTLTTSNGQITLMSPYDREKKDKYDYLIQATSDSGQTVSNYLTVNVLDINDNTPVFDFGTYQITVDQTLKVGSSIKSYTATDKDIGRNATLTYNITNGDPGNIFTIDQTGYLSLAQSLDKNVYYLTITAADNGSNPLTGSTLVVVTVEDNSMYPPLMLPMGGPHSVNLSEDSALGKGVFQFQATSNNTKSTFIFEIVSGNTNNDYQIEPMNGTILIVKFLDRERTDLYALNISATDQKGISVFAILNIYITDVNDCNPIIVPVVSVFSLTDQTPIGTVLGINVTDQDLGANGTVTLTIVNGNTKGAFNVNGTSFVTTIVMSYPDVSMYRLTFTAVDGGTPSRSSTGVAIVNILNGNIPNFITSSATISVSEDQYIGTQIYDLNATGKGAKEDGNITYKITPGNNTNVFLIRSYSGEVVISNELDYERQESYILTIVASNTGSTITTATFTLTINITNVNEAYPVFPQDSYSFDVSENASFNYPVGTVSATDSDHGPAGVITLTMPGSSDFAINQKTGEISLKTGLDYLLKQFYFYIVNAIDNGTPSKSTIVSVVFRITDINNHKPVFITPLVVSVLDSVPIGTEICLVQATDLDTGKAGNVSYEIVNPPNFQTIIINTVTGICTTNDNLNALVNASYTLRVRAFDAGTPILDNFTDLVINVVSTNPNYYNPIFSICNTNVPINRNAAISFVVLTCTATDQDKGISGQIEYKIISGNDDGYFVSDYTSGYIMTATSLLTAKNNYNLVLLAKDRGTPSRNASLAVNVAINPAITGDIKFNYSFTTPENVPRGTVIGSIDITDGRTVSAYTISTGNYDNAFNIQLKGNNGELTAMNNLDRETYIIYSLLIYATTDVDTLIITVEVLVTDLNDNPPKFDVSTLVLAVPENSPIGTLVTTVHCTDLDTDAINRNNILYLQSPGPSLFGIDQAGHLTLTSVPDFESMPSISFDIIASDNQTFTTNLKVNVRIIDVDETEKTSTSAVTDGALISREVPYQASVGLLVYTLKPGDFGLIPSLSAVIKFVAYQTISPFSVHQSTGDITVRESLADKTKYLQWVMIQVTDGANTTSKVSLLRIDTYDMASQMIVIEFSASPSYVQSILQRFRSRAQSFFSGTQRIGFSNLLDTSTNTRRRLLALQSAVYTYVVNDTSSDDMRNINQQKTFLSEKQILDVLQASRDGTPVVGLSDPSVVSVATVEPYEEKTTNNDFTSTGAGIAVFCLLALLILALIILIVTCICYRKCRKNGQKSKSQKAQTKKETGKRKSFTKMSENPSFFSTPNIIVSAPPPFTQQNIPNGKPVFPLENSQDIPPSNNDTKTLRDPSIQTGLPSQYGLKDGGNNPPSRKNNNKPDK